MGKILRYFKIDKTVHLVALSPKTARPASKTLCGKAMEDAERVGPPKRTCKACREAK